MLMLPAQARTRRSAVAVVVAIATAFVLVATPKPAQASASSAAAAAVGTVAGDRLVVTFEAGTSADRQLGTARDRGAALLHRADARRLVVRGDRARAQALAADPAVASVHLDQRVRATLVPNDPCYAGCGYVSQWALPHVGMPAAWDVTTGLATVKVAVLDTGVSSSHPDLAGQVISHVNYSQSASAADVQGHGTMVAGIIAATGNNARGVAGVAWGTRILSYKVLGDDGSGWTSDVARGIRSAADAGARVVNLSLAGTATPDVQDAVNYARTQGVLVVAAAGNESVSTPTYPAAFEGVLAVAATTPTNERASFSNYGSWVDLSAPGSNIASTTLGDNYGLGAGTSFAAPIVSGIAALLAGTTAGSNGDQISTRLKQTATPLTSGLGSGLVSASSALSGTVPAGGCGCTAPARLLDSYGGVHAVGGAAATAPGAYFGWSIARDSAAVSADKGYVLHGYGGVHPYGGAPLMTSSPYFGWDAARALAAGPTGTTFVLDAFGGVHSLAASTAPLAVAGAPYFGWDIARDIALLPNGTGGYVLDGWGGIHPFRIGSAATPPAIRFGPYFTGRDVARRIVLLPDGSGGYLLDMAGGLHPFAVGAASPPPPVGDSPYFAGRDVARDVALLANGSGGYVLDYSGGMHPFTVRPGGRPPKVVDGPYFAGRDVARAIQILA